MRCVISDRKSFFPFLPVIIIVLLLSPGSCRPKQEQTTPIRTPPLPLGSAADTCGVQPGPPTRSIPLAPGKAYRENLRPQEFHSFDIRLATGNFLQAAAEQNQAD